MHRRVTEMAVLRAQALDFDAAQVINRLLEGSLPPSVASLDPQMPMAAVEAPPSSQPSHAASAAQPAADGKLTWSASCTIMPDQEVVPRRPLLLVQHDAGRPKVGRQRSAFRTTTHVGIGHMAT